MKKLWNKLACFSEDCQSCLQNITAYFIENFDNAIVDNAIKQVSYFFTDLSLTIEEHTKGTRQRQFSFTSQAPMLSHRPRRNKRKTQNAAIRISHMQYIHYIVTILFVLLIKINFRIIISNGHVQWEERYICCKGTQI